MTAPLHIRGWAALFGEEDLVGDTIAPGAFAQSLINNPPHMVRMFHLHDDRSDIGFWDLIEERARGLWVEGRIHARDILSRAVANEVELGRLTGLSIGFRTIRAHGVKGVRRTLHELSLAEISTVIFPTIVRARIQSFERWSRAA